MKNGDLLCISSALLTEFFLKKERKIYQLIANIVYKPRSINSTWLTPNEFFARHTYDPNKDESFNWNNIK